MKRFTAPTHELSSISAHLDAIVRQTYDEIIADPLNRGVRNYDNASTFLCDESATRITRKLNKLFSRVGMTGLHATTEWHDPYSKDTDLEFDHIFTTVGDPKGNQEDFIVVDGTYLQFLSEHHRVEDQFPYAFVGSRTAAAELIEKYGDDKAGYAHSYSLETLTGMQLSVE